MERPSLVQKFYIRNIRSTKPISRTLSKAMASTLPPQKLDLQFPRKLNQTMKRLLVNQQNKVTSLEVQVWKNMEFLMEENLRFENLESLTLICGKKYGYDQEMKAVCEYMIGKYADKLTKLKIEGLQVNLVVPDLPLLDSLDLYDVCSDANWTLLSKCKQTITSMDMNDCELGAPPGFQIDDPNRNDVFYIPNLKNLMLNTCVPFTINFLIFNASHLESLTVYCVDIPMNLNLGWKDYPNLRELEIHFYRLLPLLEKSRRTLECLVIQDIPYALNYVGVLPKLTDLYLIAVDDPEVSNVVADNYLSLEIMFLNGVDVSSLDDGMRMEKMRMVVLRSETGIYSFTDQDREKMARLCPNAKVIMLEKETKIEIMDYLRSRRKMKGFKMNMAYKFIEEFF